MSPRYQKGYGDLAFIAYFVVIFCLVRQTLAVNMCQRFARSFGIKKQAKLDRFGEQGYAFIYFGIMGAWGCVSYPFRIGSLRFWP
jgi:very-long-chain ceramide synthase